MKFWESLSEKGKYSTIIGFILGLGTTVIYLYVMIENKEFSYIPFAVGFGASLLFFILPSFFKLTSKLFNLEVKD